jgi:hypothetical protein
MRRGFPAILSYIPIHWMLNGQRGGTTQGRMNIITSPVK